MMRVGLAMLVLSTAWGCARDTTTKDGDKTPAVVASKGDTASPTPAKPGTKPSPETPPAPKATVSSARDLAKVLDLAALPTIEGSKFSARTSAQIEGSAPGTPGQVIDFYTEKLGSLGWKAEKTADPITDDSGGMQYVKDGHLVSLSSFKAGGKGEVYLMITFHGDFLPESLPRVEGAQSLTRLRTASIDKYDGELSEVAKKIVATFAADGWQEVNAAKNPTPGPQNMTFRKQGYLAKLFLNPAPAHGNKPVGQYSVRVLAHELPTPPDAIGVQFDDANWKLFATSPSDLKTVGEFYQKTMPAIGYTTGVADARKEKSWTLRFGTDAGDVIMVLLNVRDGKTAIELRGIPAKFLKEKK